MALNKSMHPRNRYKDQPPNFAHLASKYPEFQKHVSVSLSGRVSLNFKDPEAVRALTCTLLKEDFGLTIDIPLERLIPTVPLRLNYIHWVEDILNYHSSDKSTVRRGIDIVVKVPQKTLLMDALKEESDIMYDFCMCNPPFFANQMEAQGVNSRNPRRPPPSSVNTGGITEIMAEGGELEFVKRIIHDSLQLKKRLRWYSCMLGKKCSLAPLKEELQIQGVSKVAYTEFYQGKTMRWALAWSFYDDVTIPAPPFKKRKLEKPRKPMLFTVLETTVIMLKEKFNGSQSPTPSYVALVTGFLKKILTDLKVEHKYMPCGKEEESLFLTAIENSWVHNRRKKRNQMRQLKELPRAPEKDFMHMSKMETPTLKEDSRQDVQTPEASVAPEEKSKSTPDFSSATSASSNPDPMQHPEDTNPESIEDTLALSDEAKDTSRSQNTETDDHDSSKVLNQITGEGSQPVQGNCSPFLFKCLLNVKKETPNVLVELHWVEGQNKDLMNQLCTYLRNQLCRLASS
ncbi:RNA N(6)-adenosine-methyltransferase METTL16 isoform X2 [Lithobates pipiens]